MKNNNEKFIACIYFKEHKQGYFDRKDMRHWNYNSFLPKGPNIHRFKGSSWKRSESEKTSNDHVISTCRHATI